VAARGNCGRCWMGGGCKELSSETKPRCASDQHEGGYGACLEPTHNEESAVVPLLKVTNDLSGRFPSGLQNLLGLPWSTTRLSWVSFQAISV
jgi:hypothetical protein